jgi:hypothetical protein
MVLTLPAVYMEVCFWFRFIMLSVSDKSFALLIYLKMCVHELLYLLLSRETILANVNGHIIPGEVHFGCTQQLILLKAVSFSSNMRRLKILLCFTNGAKQISSRLHKGSKPF